MNCFGILMAVFQLVLFVTSASVGHNLFGHRVAKGMVTSGDLDAITGMAASHIHKDIVYMHSYQVDENLMYAVNVKTGEEISRIRIEGATNFDWEDMTLGPCADDCRTIECRAGLVPTRYCIYIADIGNHRGDGPRDIIYMVREPDILSNSSSLKVVDTLTFSWPEVDAETLMIAPDARLFVVSKVNHGRAMLAELPNSAWGTTVNLDLANTGILKIYTDHHDPQGGDISPDGTEMILVGEEEVFYYSISDGKYIDAVRNTIPEVISSYSAIPDTEAITWSPDGKGFYTIARGPNQLIYFYPKDMSNSVPIG